MWRSTARTTLSTTLRTWREPSRIGAEVPDRADYALHRHHRPQPQTLRQMADAVHDNARTEHWAYCPLATPTACIGSFQTNGGFGRPRGPQTVCTGPPRRCWRNDGGGRRRHAPPGGAYGHGAVQTARTLAELGCEYLAVSNIDEARELRLAGVELPILQLGLTPSASVQVSEDCWSVLVSGVPAELSGAFSVLLWPPEAFPSVSGVCSPSPFRPVTSKLLHATSNTTVPPHQSGGHLRHCIQWDPDAQL